MPTSKVYTNTDLKVPQHPPDILDDIEDTTALEASPPDILDDESVEEPDEYVSPRGMGFPPADTFGKGFARSILSGEALDAGLLGAKGFLKGATLDIPESIVGAFNAVMHPIDTVKSIPEGLRKIAELTSQAGARPEEFGRMMGQLTGQPLTTAGIAKVAPPVIKGAVRTAGVPVETAGRIMRKHQPVSGFLPRLIEGRTLRSMEKTVGDAIEKMGIKMRSKVVDGKIVKTIDPEFSEGIIVDSTEKALPPSQTSYYNPETMPSAPIITPTPKAQLALPPSKTSFYSGPSPEFVKTKIRLNRDGTFTNMLTGEVYDKLGNPLNGR